MSINLYIYHWNRKNSLMHERSDSSITEQNKWQKNDCTDNMTEIPWHKTEIKFSNSKKGFRTSSRLCGHIHTVISIILIFALKYIQMNKMF